MLLTERQKVVSVQKTASPVEVRASWTRIAEPVLPFLEKVSEVLAEQVKSFEPAIGPYAHYALTNQGKQLRPALVGLSGNAMEKLSDDLIKVAVIIEMVHLATLVHDDVIDIAEMRRSRPTLASKWGNEIAVLVGDCLFAHAMELTASFPTVEMCRIIASATNKVCTGEILQIQQRGNAQLRIEEYYGVLGMKTATLFALACELGAAFTPQYSKYRTEFHRFGWNLGIAYQIYDDCLDLFGSERIAGKSLGTDLANGKFTLPILLAMEKANAADQILLKNFLLPWKAEALNQIMTILAKYETLSESKKIIEQFLEKARLELKGVQSGRNITALLELTDFLSQQTQHLGE